MFLNVMGIPPGSSWHRPERSVSNKDEILLEHDLISSIAEITADDVCIGNNPLYFKINSEKELSETLKEKVKQILLEFNSIIKWVAFDILTKGISVYTVKESGGKFLIFPYLENVELFWTKKKEVVVVDSEKKEIKEVLLFVHYDKKSFEKLDDDKYFCKINPVALQLKNLSKSGRDLDRMERDLFRYRKQLSRIARFITVDIGVSQGTVQQEVVDSISSAINADSMSLPQNPNIDDFDDSIPIIPHRKNVGKPELTSVAADANIKDLKDFEYLLNKIYLITRFPKSYADFSKEIDATAVSLIKGDIRYSRLVDKARTLIENQINAFLQTNKVFKEYEIEFVLTEYPTPEDADVIDALDEYSKIVAELVESIKESETKEEAMLKISVLDSLLGGTSNLPSIRDSIDLCKTFIEEYFVGTVEEEEFEEIDKIPRLRKGQDIYREPKEEPKEEPEEEPEELPDIELIEPSTNEK